MAKTPLSFGHSEGNRVKNIWKMTCSSLAILTTSLYKIDNILERLSFEKFDNITYIQKWENFRMTSLHMLRTPWSFHLWYLWLQSKHFDNIYYQKKIIILSFDNWKNLIDKLGKLVHVLKLGWVLRLFCIRSGSSTKGEYS